MARKLVGEIMSRFPTKDLLRFRSVSKPFSSLIDSNSNLSRRQFDLTASLDQPSFVLTNYYVKCLSNPKFSFDNYCVDLYSLEHDTRNLHTKIHNPFPDHDATVIIGSCRHLLLMQPFEKYSRLAVLNPTTKDCHLLPELNDEVVIFAGFGYDGVHNTYKVVTITGVPSASSDDLELSIYDGTWRKVVIPFVKDYGYMGPLIRPVCVGGAVYWYRRRYEATFQMAILGFDLAQDKFFPVITPEFGDVLYSDMDMTVFDGRLCLLCELMGYKDEEERMDIWVAESDDEEWRWTKLLSISEHRSKLENEYKGLMVPICYSACRTKILFNVNSYHLCWYHVDKMEFHAMDEYNGVIYSGNHFSRFVVNSFLPSLAGNGRIF